MRTMMWFALIAVAAAVGVPALILAFDAPTAPPPMTTVENAFDGVDFRDLPARQTFIARDGTRLAYRAYPGTAARTVILIHGSSGNAAGMHPVARAIRAGGATVYALTMRGHGGTGRDGDVDYIGQLDDDLADFMATLGPQRPGERRTLLGFSSGGGFVLRVMGEDVGRAFDRFILVSPQLTHDAPTTRPASGGWVSVAVPRIVVLTALSRFGIDAFGGLPVIAFAVPPEKRNVQTAVYSFRMLTNFGAPRDYLTRLHAAPGPVTLFAGAADTLIDTARYAALLRPVRADLGIVILPGLGHMDMIVKPPALAAIAATANQD